MYYKDLQNKIHFLSDEDIAKGGEKFLPESCIQITDQEAAAIHQSQNQPTSEQIEAAFTAAIQSRLDDFARTRNYDSILSACTYATSTVPKFQGEGQACVNLRDATWAAAYDILAQVQAAQRAMPISIADIEADLPALGWPA
jgi:hypothetical protein